MVLDNMVCVYMEKKLLEQIKEEVRKTKKLLKEMEKDKNFLEKAENFQREIGCISSEDLLTQFNI